MEFALLALGIWAFGACAWLVITLIEWSVSRDFPNLHNEQEIAEKARQVLQTPIWPLALLGMLGRILGRLANDARRP